MKSKFSQGKVFRCDVCDDDILVVSVLSDTPDQVELTVAYLDQKTGKPKNRGTLIITVQEYPNWVHVLEEE